MYRREFIFELFTEHIFLILIFVVISVIFFIVYDKKNKNPIYEDKEKSKNLKNNIYPYIVGDRFQAFLYIVIAIVAFLVFYFSE